MRIALVVHDFTPSLGHGRYTYELARRFRGEHDVHVFANTFGGDQLEGVTYHKVPALRVNALATVLTFILPATRRLGRHWDVIHAQGACVLRFDVITAHICNAAWARAQRASRVGRTWRQRIFEALVVPLERGVFRTAQPTGIIAISNQVKRELTALYGVSAGAHVIHHGVDSERFSPATRDRLRPGIRQQLGLAEAGFVGLFVGDLRKGGETALEVLALIPGIRLILVTRSDPTLFRARAESLGVADRALFRPPSEAIEQYYAAADVFLYPTPYDAFGLVISEAMAMGLPVITSRHAGASELIADGDNGYVVQSARDPGPIAECLRGLVNDPFLHDRMGAAARTTVVSLTWDAVARKTMDVYQLALARR